MSDLRINSTPVSECSRNGVPRVGDSSMPVSVFYLACGSVVQAMLAFLAFVLGRLIIGFAEMDGGKATYLDLAMAATLDLWACVHLILAVWTMFVVPRRRPTGWAVCFAFLFWGAAASCVLFQLVLIAAIRFEPSIRDLVLSSLLALGMSALAFTFFRAHPWFGIRRRDAWGALRRRGGWALILAAVVEMGPIILGALANR